MRPLNELRLLLYRWPSAMMPTLVPPDRIGRLSGTGWATGYIGGIKERTAKSIMEGRFPERVIVKAVERMITRGTIKQADMLKIMRTG